MVVPREELREAYMKAIQLIKSRHKLLKPPTSLLERSRVREALERYGLTEEDIF